MALYSVQYVRSLEAQISNTADEATLVAPERLLDDQPENGPSSIIADPQITREFPISRSATDRLEVTFMAPLDTSDNMIYDIDMLQSEGNLFSVTDVADHDTTARSATPVHILGQGFPPTSVEVSIHEGALFFQVYFEAIHPRYPFLDVEECSRGYQDWKTGQIFTPGSDAWRSYLVKMACQEASYSSQSRAHPNVKTDLRRRIPFEAGKTRLLHKPAAPQPDAASSGRPSNSN